MKRAAAFTLARQQGGTPSERVTKATRALIVGELGWPLQTDGQPSKNLILAKSYGTPILSERRFLKWVGAIAPENQTRVYTGAELASLSRLPAETIEQLAMFGLIEPSDGLHSFQDLAAARQVAQLMDSGVDLTTITRSLRDIQSWLPDARLSNLRLVPESKDQILVAQSEGRTDSKGQFVLSVGKSDEADVDELFAEAQSAEETGDLSRAEGLYHRVMKLDPADPAAALNRGNVLRAQGRSVEAEAAYRSAVKVDSAYAPAWHNLADLLDEKGRLTEAVDCEKRALDADPFYADAMFNLALFLQRAGVHREAARWWRRYLEADRTSAWAERAKRALKYCEMQASAAAADDEPAPAAPARP